MSEITAVELNELRKVFRSFFTLFGDTPDAEVDMYLELSNAKRVGKSVTVQRYSVALYAAYLLSVKAYQVQQSKSTHNVGEVSRELGDRKTTYASGNSLAQLQVDPYGYLAQWNLFVEQNTPKYGLKSIGGIRPITRRGRYD